MAARLKTYRTQSGFFELIVAVPNQKAALSAWGVHADLFAQGFASVADDPSAVQAAVTSPGVVLRRAVGSDDPWRAPDEEAALPDVPDASRRTVRLKAKTPAPAPKPTPDRGPLNRAERAAAEHEAHRVAEEARRAEELAFMRNRHEAEREQEARQAEKLEAERRRATEAYERACASLGGARPQGRK